MEIISVVLCGGAGSRLWPFSRASLPKPFASMFGFGCLFEATLKRNQFLNTSPLIVCGEQHRFLVQERLKQGAIILEPAPRNTAPAAALAAIHLVSQGKDPLLLISPADHLIQDNQSYQEAITKGARHAEAGSIVVFGCQPIEPHAGYGYIEIEAELESEIFSVASFTEKPDYEKAKQYLAKGNYFWNSGIFLCRASVYLSALKNFRPEIYAACIKSMERISQDNVFVRPEKDTFLNCFDDSIDHAIMEKAKNRIMVSLNVGWSDVGSWRAVAELSENVGDIYFEDVENTYINASSRLVAAVGVKDLVIVETRDAVLVLNKNTDQKVKNLVKRLIENNRVEASLPSCVHRPWGTYETIEESAGFKVKRIIVRPGEMLSLQMHKYRSEHWVIVRGEATVTSGEKTFKLLQNQSIHIPPLTKHRLANDTGESLELIEVQCGSHLSEDDIVRFEDQYGRAEIVS